MNRWFANTGEMYAASVEAQLRVAMLSKLLLVTTARRQPTLRQLRPQLVLARVVPAITLPEEPWELQCAARRRANRTVR